MDPFTLGVVAVGGAIINALVGLGAVAAPVAGAAAAAGPITTAAVAVGAPAAAASVAGAGVPAGIVATNPHAAKGAQNGINDAINRATADFATSVNGLQIPGLPPLAGG